MKCRRGRTYQSFFQGFVPDRPKPLSNPLAGSQNAARSDGAALSTAVAELERCLAVNQELQAATQELQQRLASSKAMLEQRDELIRQLNASLRTATQAKEAAQQKANDLDMRVSANMRTIATLSTEIAEVGRSACFFLFSSVRSGGAYSSRILFKSPCVSVSRFSPISTYPFKRG